LDEYLRGVRHEEIAGHIIKCLSGKEESSAFRNFEIWIGQINAVGLEIELTKRSGKEARWTRGPSERESLQA
jgi:hypothetical protein